MRGPQRVHPSLNQPAQLEAGQQWQKSSTHLAMVPSLSAGIHRPAPPRPTKSLKIVSVINLTLRVEEHVSVVRKRPSNENKNLGRRGVL